jgi:hypothetical protein
MSGCWYCVGMLCNFWPRGWMMRTWKCWWGWCGGGRGGVFSLVCGIIHYIGSMCVYNKIKYGIVCVCKCNAHLLFLFAEVTYVKLFSYI